MELVDYDVISAEYVTGFELKIKFQNGKTGQLDFSQYFSKTGVYSELRDNPELFRNFKIADGILCWKDGQIDIAPETLYHDSTGEPYPEWLEA